MGREQVIKSHAVRNKGLALTIMQHHANTRVQHQVSCARGVQVECMGRRGTARDKVWFVCWDVAAYKDTVVPRPLADRTGATTSCVELTCKEFEFVPASALRPALLQDNTDAIVFVIDSADAERMEEANLELMKLLTEEDKLAGVPVIVCV